MVGFTWLVDAIKLARRRSSTENKFNLLFKFDRYMYQISYMIFLQLIYLDFHCHFLELFSFYCKRITITNEMLLQLLYVGSITLIYSCNSRNSCKYSKMVWLLIAVTSDRRSIIYSSFLSVLKIYFTFSIDINIIIQLFWKCFLRQCQERN